MCFGDFSCFAEWVDVVWITRFDLFQDHLTCFCFAQPTYLAKPISTAKTRHVYRGRLSYRRLTEEAHSKIPKILSVCFAFLLALSKKKHRKCNRITEIFILIYSYWVLKSYQCQKRERRVAATGGRRGGGRRV